MRINLTTDFTDYADLKTKIKNLKTGMIGLLNTAYNFCYGNFASSRYFATLRQAPEDEEKREIREKILKYKNLRMMPHFKSIASLFSDCKSH